MPSSQVQSHADSLKMDGEIISPGVQPDTDSLEAVQGGSQHPFSGIGHLPKCRDLFGHALSNLALKNQ